MNLIQLWQWSAAVQLTSLAMIAIFFAVLARSIRAAELRWWVAAWVMDFLALAVTLAYWYLQPPESLFPLITTLYMTSKLAFVLLLLQGAWTIKWPGGILLRPSHAVTLLASYAVAAPLFVKDINHVGIVTHVTIGGFLVAGATFLLRKPADRSLSWLAAGFLLRSALCLAEAAAYGVQIFGLRTLQTETAWFLSSHSAFDSGAEWFIALGCVLGLSERTQRDLQRTNSYLLSAQEDLRRLVDRDPLTGLANRRSLPQILREVQPYGAMIFFFDLDDFKLINDRHGHQIGDQCLERFADALRHCFRPSDHLVRYAGDEFLVVASGLDRSASEERIQKVRERINFRGNDGPRIRFSAGFSELAPGGDPESALEAADASMYAGKAARRGPKSLATADA